MATSLPSYPTAAPLSPSDTEQNTVSILAELTRLFTDAIHTAFPQARALGQGDAVIALVEDPKFDHQYQCNSAFAVFNRLKTAAGGAAGDKKKKEKKKGKGDAKDAEPAPEPPAPEPPAPEPDPATPAPAPAVDLGPIPASPQAAAQAVIAAIEAKGPHFMIGKLAASGPGYINIYLATNYLKSRLGYTVRHGVKPTLIPGDHKRRVVIDYSSPNIAKEMHIGHLRSTIIGDALARILEYCGHEIVQRANHVGDWGTQFGMLLAHVKELLAEGKVTDEQLDASLRDVTTFYRDAKKRFDADEGFKKRAHQEVVKLQALDPENIAFWKRMVAASAKMFDQVYERLGVDKRLELLGESFYNDKIPAVVQELKDKGICEVDNGALIIRVPGQEVPVMLVKSDGGYGYDSTDMAALKYRLTDLGGDWLVYVVDQGQGLHFDLIFGAGRLAGWYDPAVTRVEHAGFGVILGEDGKKLKTRSGDSVRLVDVLDEAKERVVKTYQAEGADAESGRPKLTPEEIERASSILGYGGMKYYDLKQNRHQDYGFSYERMLSADGNTVVYLEYAHARIESIFRKAAEEDVNVEAVLAYPEADYDKAFLFTHRSEMALAVELCRFQEVIVDVQVDLLPHKLCEYIYGLSGKFSDFFRDCRVLGESVDKDVSASRLRLCKATLATMKTGMMLLGIEPLEKM